MFRPVLKEASTNFHGDVMDGIYTAETWKFGWGDAKGVSNGRGIRELVSGIRWEWEEGLGLWQYVI